jgi:hypothetical protein
MAREYYASLAARGTSEPFRSRMLDFTSLNELIGTPDMLALGKRYESTAAKETRVSEVAKSARGSQRRNRLAEK